MPPESGGTEPQAGRRWTRNRRPARLRQQLRAGDGRNTGGGAGIGRVSDLARHPQLRLGLSQEFLNRKDGWEALKAAYGLPFVPRGLDHGLAYEALAAMQLDVIDVYSTDAKIERYKLRVLEDDRAFPGI